MNRINPSGELHVRIAICDDEERYRIELKTTLEKLLINADYNIDTFDDGNKLSAAFAESPYDIVFLDIEMPAVDGITLAKRIRARSENVQDKRGNSKQIIIKEDGEENLIDIASVIYMESENQNVRIVTTDGEHTIRYNIGDFEEKLKNDGFFRIHRGYLISLSKIKSFSKGDALMEDGTLLPVSRSNQKALKEALYSFVEESCYLFCWWC